MELQAKLDQLRKTVLDDSFVQRDRRMQELKEEKAKYIKEIQVAVLTSTNQYIAAEERKLEKEVKRERSALEFEHMKQLRLKRLELEARCMAELREKLLAFTRSPDYADHLRAALKEVDLTAFSQKTVALCAQGDKTVPQVLEGIPCREDPAVQVGGFCLKDPERRLMLDLTLDKKLEEARHAFLTVAGLKESKE